MQIVQRVNQPSKTYLVRKKRSSSTHIGYSHGNCSSTSRSSQLTNPKYKNTSIYIRFLVSVCLCVDYGRSEGWRSTRTLPQVQGNKSNEVTSHGMWCKFKSWRFTSLGKILAYKVLDKTSRSTKFNWYIIHFGAEYINLDSKRISFTR